MSLRRKIVLLFLGLAVMPMLIVATFGFVYAGWLAESVTRSRLSDTAVRVASEIEAATGRLEASLAWVYRTHDGSADGTGRPSKQLGLEAALADAAYIRFHSADGTLLASAGVRPESGLRCDASGGSRLLPIRAPTPGTQGGVTEAGIWAADLLPADLRDASQSVQVIDRSTGAILYSPRCEDLTGRPSPALAAAVRALEDGAGARDRFRFRNGSGEMSVGALRLSPDHQWAAATSASVHAIMAPLERLETSYWVFIGLLALSTVAAFSLLLGRVTQSLKELTRAAERIGGGDLQPWLPPPGNDEVGQLTMAFSDMLDRVRRMMAHVDHSGRLAVVGQLSSYLAHEIRNPLSAIKMNLQRLDRSVRAGRLPADCADAVDISLKEVDRLASSVTSILQLGRSDQGPRDVVSLHEVIEEAAELLRGELTRAGVKVHVELDASADRVLAVPGQMKGVFLNLMMNALEAQPSGGRLVVRSQLETSPDHEPVVAIRVRDHGPGVPAAVRDRIFEPFFTTKPTGSGIGLAVVERTLRDNGGDIRLEDLPISERGAEFIVTLPLAPVAAESDMVAPSPSGWLRTARSWGRHAARGRTDDVSVTAPSTPAGESAEPATLSAEANEALTAWVKDRGHVH